MGTAAGGRRSCISELHLLDAARPLPATRCTHTERVSNRLSSRSISSANFFMASPMFLRLPVLSCACDAGKRASHLGPLQHRQGCTDEVEESVPQPRGVQPVLKRQTLLWASAAAGEPGPVGQLDSVAGGAARTSITASSSI